MILWQQQPWSIVSKKCSVCVNFDQLQPQTDLEHDLGADEEMEYIEISLAFEETNGITIAPEEIYEAKTVGRLVELVTVLLAQKVNVP